MNKFTRFISIMLTNGCYVLGGLVLFKVILGGSSISKKELISLILVSILCGALQTLCFSRLIIKKMAYCWRTAIFGVALLAVLSVIAVSFGWFPANHLGAWATFAAAFLVILLVVTAIFQLYYRHRSKKYNEQLDQYHTKQNGAE